MNTRGVCLNKASNIYYLLIPYMKLAEHYLQVFFFFCGIALEDVSPMCIAVLTTDRRV